MLYAKTLQVLRLEMLQQAILGSRGRKDPVIQLKDKETRTESLLKRFLFPRSIKTSFGKNY